MRSGVCPKCGHGTVYSGRDVPMKASSNNMIPIGKHSYAALDNYVCTTCGYVESYISDEQARQRISEQWDDASKSKRKRLS